MTYFVKGDVIEVSCDGRTVDGVVVVMSPNQVSAVIEFEAIFGKHCGAMPILLHDDGTYRSLIDGTEVTLAKKERAS